MRVARGASPGISPPVTKGRLTAFGSTDLNSSVALIRRGAIPYSPKS